VTYSIVARDAETGHLGVAAQSYYLALGSVLPWARAGVGAVATQSWVDPGYGPRVLELLASGVPVADALAEVRAADEDHEQRQVGVVDATGAVAFFSGANCLPEVSHAAGDGYTAQANIMARPGVCEAMAEAFEGARGPLADRLLRALSAAQQAGGDLRGQMSAALLVVDAEVRENTWEGVLFDLRVDHHPAPVEELGRLVCIAQAAEYEMAAYSRMEAGDFDGGLAAVDVGLALRPDDPDLLGARACALLGLGRTREARAIVETMSATPGWAASLLVVSRGGFLPFLDQAALEKLLSS